ncbi:hypothetical protein KEM48_006249 [Puccinia striiformis f. sp. tritici PST-130]|nr:hypothetical protein KEM48_006249 [Puccinia striiformis f. sp. tritici PST-130]
MLVVITTLSVFLSCITQSLAWHYSGPNFVKTGHFQMGQSNVTFCYPRITPAGLTILTPAARVESLTPVSLTPIRCDRFECHPATSSPPELASCKIVAQTLLNNFTGTVTLPPKTFVVVSHKNCAAILQNHDKEHDYPLQFTWTQSTLTPQPQHYFHPLEDWQFTDGFWIGLSFNPINSRLWSSKAGVMRPIFSSLISPNFILLNPTKTLIIRSPTHFDTHFIPLFFAIYKEGKFGLPQLKYLRHPSGQKLALGV